MIRMESKISKALKLKYEPVVILWIDRKYVIFKHLSKVSEDEEPVVIVFVVEPHQLSALIILASYSKDGVNNVIIPMGAGCYQIGIHTYKEGNQRIRGLYRIVTQPLTQGSSKRREDTVERSFLEIGI